MIALDLEETMLALGFDSCLSRSLGPLSRRLRQLEQEREAKFEAAEAKARREGVDSLTSEDIDGLSPEQLKNWGAIKLDRTHSPHYAQNGFLPVITLKIIPPSPL